MACASVVDCLVYLAVSVTVTLVCDELPPESASFRVMVLPATDATRPRSWRCRGGASYGVLLALPRFTSPAVLTRTDRAVIAPPAVEAPWRSGCTLMQLPVV